MSPVSGSRHYTGAGLGQIGIWGCPSCGEDNTGPLTEGCAHCGAGRPAEKAPPPPTPPTPPVNQSRQGDVADAWAERHPDVTVADAYRSGYMDGVRAARAAAPPPPIEPGTVTVSADAKTYRTLAAALALFRDQVLVGQPEEVASGEWLSAREATGVIAHLLQLQKLGVTEVYAHD